MLFDDLFYPDNVKRREEVANLRAEIKLSFKKYAASWNEMVTLFNTAFSQAKDPHYSNVRIPLLKKNIEVDTIGDCITEIQTVAENTNKVLDDFVKRIKLDELLPKDWKTKGCTVDEFNSDSLKQASTILSSVLGGGAGALVGFYIFEGVATMSVIMAGISGAAVSLGVLVGGALAGAVVGGVIFVVTDLIVSAIMGAVERKQLNEAIDSLRNLKNGVCPSLDRSARKIEGIVEQIETGIYKLDSKHILYKDENGNYVILSLGASKINAEVNAMNLKSLSVKEKIVFIAA